MDSSFGNWIRRRRKALDLTQQDLARRIGCSPSLIFKIESDERRPSRQIADLLAQHLEIPAEERELFRKVARQEKMVETLEDVSPLATPEPEPVPQPLTTNIPTPLTPLIGRDHEVHAIIRQINDPICRLLTLTGPGGVGKTRLSLEVAHQLQHEFECGAAFVSLVGTSAPEFIIPAIADALGFSFSGTFELKTQLFNFLKEKQILLVLDNLEHLLSGIELLDELLEHAPHAKLLTTSREQLNLRTEWIFEVQGLPVPTGVEKENLEANSAIALFSQRARQVKMDFTLTADDAQSISQICRLVDGLPLGLELAATWVRMMSIKEIVCEIEKSLDFLSTTGRDVPQRHRSIRVVFDQSWNLLSEEERAVMRRLSVFRGGFTREAAEQVANANLRILSVLVEKSLVRRSEVTRYDLHELTRQYAASRLHDDPADEEQTNSKYTGYYLTLLQTHEPLLRSEHQPKTLRELAAEMDNIRAAWNMAVTRRDISLLKETTKALYYFYEMHQYFQEVEHLYREAAEMVQAQIEQLPATESVKRAELEGALGSFMTHRAFFLQRMGRNQEATVLHRNSIEILQRLDEPYPLAFAMVLYGTLCWAVGNLQEAKRYLQDGLPMGRALNLAWLPAIALCFGGATSHDLGQYEEAYNQFSEAMELCRKMKDPYLTLLISTVFSRTAQFQGRISEAQQLLSENLQIARESGNRWAMGLGLEQMASVAQASGDHAGARKMFQESVALYREVGDPWSLSRALNALTQYELSQSRVKEAEVSALHALKTAAEVEYNLNALEALANLVTIHARQGKFQTSLELALFVQAHSASSKHARERVEDIRLKLESQLTPQQIEHASARVHAMTLTSLVLELAVHQAHL